MLFSVIICRIWSFATAINKLLFDKNCHICNSYQKGAIFYQSHKVFYTTPKNIKHLKQQTLTRSNWNKLSRILKNVYPKKLKIQKAGYLLLYISIIKVTFKTKHIVQSNYMNNRTSLLSYTH